MYKFEIDSINPTHVLLFLTVVAVIYAAWTICYLTWESRRANGEERRNRKTAFESNGNVRKADIMGKSKFVLSEHMPPTPPVVKVTEQAPEHPRQIAREELDDVFGAPPEGESNEPLDVYHPLYVEQSLPTETPYYGEVDDENESLPLRGQYPAQGVKFEELGDAYHRVVYNPSLTESEQEETGRILLGLKPTDMFEYIISGSGERENKAIYLMETYLEAFRKRMEAEEAESLPPQDVVAPRGYSVFDNVKPIRRPR